MWIDVNQQEHVAPQQILAQTGDQIPVLLNLFEIISVHMLRDKFPN